MKIIKKIFKVIWLLALSLVLLAAAADAAWIYIPQIKALGKIEGIAEAAHSAEDISTSTEAQVIALGETTHGNVEFQQLKLSVLQQLAETEGVRAFALEADFGEGYTWAMHLLPLSQRIKDKPLNLYDAMIFYYETTPVAVI